MKLLFIFTSLLYAETVDECSQQTNVISSQMHVITVLDSDNLICIYKTTATPIKSNSYMKNNAT